MDELSLLDQMDRAKATPPLWTPSVSSGHSGSSANFSLKDEMDCYNNHTLLSQYAGDVQSIDDAEPISAPAESSSPSLWQDPRINTQTHMQRAAMMSSMSSHTSNGQNVAGKTVEGLALLTGVTVMNITFLTDMHLLLYLI